MSSTNAQLQETIAQLEADLSAAVGDLDGIKAKARDEVSRIKAGLKKDAAKFEANRQKELKQARSAYDTLLETAAKTAVTLQEQIPELLGIPGQAARDAQLKLLGELFGEL